MAEPETRHVVIRLDQKGGGSKVTIDGREVPGCFAVRLDGRVDKSPVVTFSVYADRVDADVRALVEATTRDGRDATIGELLGRINDSMDKLNAELTAV